MLTLWREFVCPLHGYEHAKPSSVSKLHIKDRDEHSTLFRRLA